MKTVRKESIAAEYGRGIAKSEPIHRPDAHNATKLAERKNPISLLLPVFTTSFHKYGEGTRPSPANLFYAFKHTVNYVTPVLIGL